MTNSAEQKLPVFGGPEPLLHALTALRPMIASRAAEMDETGAMSADVFSAIRNTGILRAMHPAYLGGAEFTAPDMLPIMEELGCSDGSTAWSFMVASEVPAFFQRLSEQVQRNIFRGGCDVLARAPVSPRPGARKVPGGLQINGRFPFASGSFAADWFFIGAIVLEEDGSPAVTEDGRPDIRLCVIPGDEVEVLDNWQTIGLRSTESHDVLIKDVFVPADHTAPMLGSMPADGPRIRQHSFYTSMGPMHMGVVLGIVKGMLNDLVEIAQTKKPFINPNTIIRDEPLFQYRIGEMHIRYAASRSLAVSESEAIWHFDGGRTVPPPIVRARYRAVTAFIHDECSKLGAEIFKLAGTAVLYNNSTLQRRFRDLRTACQHVMGNSEINVPYGALALGVNLPDPDLL